MCSAKGDDVNSSTESSRTSSYSSDDDSSVESVSNSHLIPPPSFAEDTTSFVPLGPYTRTTRRRKVALVASLLAVAIAVGAGWSGSCWAGLCGADDGRSGARQRAELKTDRDVATLRQEVSEHDGLCVTYEQALPVRLAKRTREVSEAIIATAKRTRRAVGGLSFFSVISVSSLVAADRERKKWMLLCSMPSLLQTPREVLKPSSVSLSLYGVDGLQVAAGVN